MSKEDEGEGWVAYGPVGEGKMPAVRMPLSEAREEAARDRRRMERRLRKAPFPLYGLPSSWEGGRFLGGGTWGGPTGHEETRSLSLVHGVLVEGEGPMLIVETALADERGSGGPLRVLAEDLWAGLANTVPEAVTWLRSGGSVRSSLSSIRSLRAPNASCPSKPGRCPSTSSLSRGAGWHGRG